MVELNNSRGELATSSKSQGLGSETNEKKGDVDENQHGTRQIAKKAFGYIQAGIYERDSKSNNRYNFCRLERISNQNSWFGYYASDLVSLALALLWIVNWFLDNGKLPPIKKLELTILAKALKGVEHVISKYEDRLRKLFEQELDVPEEPTQS